MRQPVSVPRFFTLVCGLLLGAAALSAAPARADSGGVVRMGGSTTLLPIIAKVASDFMEKYGTWDQVDPALPKEEIVLFVSGGGSSFGVRSVLNGTVEIGLVSRHLKEKE